MFIHSISTLCAALGLSALMLSAPLAQTTTTNSSTTTPTSPGGDEKSTLESPKLGQGETTIATALARESLAQAGISQPTPAHMQTALRGGDVTRSDGSTVSLVGVLAQRQSGLGWGQIAQSMGVNLGSLVSASKTSQAGKKPASTAAGSAKPARVENAKTVAAQNKSDGAARAGTNSSNSGKSSNAGSGAGGEGGGGGGAGGGNGGGGGGGNGGGGGKK